MEYIVHPMWTEILINMQNISVAIYLTLFIKWEAFTAGPSELTHWPLGDLNQVLNK